MSARAMPTDSTGRPANRVLSMNSVRSAKPATSETANPFGLASRTPQPKNGDGVFDAKAFLARAGFGKKILNLKKDEPTPKAIPPTPFFTCRRGG